MAHLGKVAITHTFIIARSKSKVAMAHTYTFKMASYLFSTTNKLTFVLFELLILSKHKQQVSGSDCVWDGLGFECMAWDLTGK